MGRLKNIFYLWLILVFVDFIFRDLTLESAIRTMVYSIVIAIVSELIVLILTRKNRHKWQFFFLLLINNNLVW